MGYGLLDGRAPVGGNTARPVAMGPTAVDLHWNTSGETRPHGILQGTLGGDIGGPAAQSGNDDSKDFYQLLFLLFFRGHLLRGQWY